MTIPRLFLAVFLTAAPASAAKFELVSVSGYAPTLPTRFVNPLERLVRRKSGSIKIVDIDNVAGAYTGHRLRYNMADMPETELWKLPAGQDHATTALETVDGFFLFAPADPALTAEMLEEIRSYPVMPPVAQRPAKLRRLDEPGGPFLEAVIDSPKKVADQKRDVVATIYHLTVDGKPVDAVFFLKTTGGLGRAAGALAAHPPEAPRLLLSRGDWEFRDENGGLKGRELWDAIEKMGVKYSAIGRGELRQWDALQKYREEKPDGVRFLSANLVSGDTPVLPSTATVELGGARVGIIGVTRANYSKYLGRGSLSGLTISNPLEAVRNHVRELRAQSDVVVVLSNLDGADNTLIRDHVRGIDLVISRTEESTSETSEPKTQRLTDRRGPFPPALSLASEYPDALTRLQVEVGPVQQDGARSLDVRYTHLLLDDSVADAPGYPHFDATPYELAVSSIPALIPPAHKLFPEGSRFGGSRTPRLTARDFWTLAASLMADRTKSEAAVLPATSIGTNVPGDFTEPQVRSWFGWDDVLVTFELEGSYLSELLREASSQEDRERRDLPLAPGQMRLAAGGVGEGGKIHAVDVDPALVYRVVGTELLLANTEAYPSLSNAKNVERVGELREVVLDDLKRRSRLSWSAERYAELMAGRPVKERGLWTLNFRDIALNVSQTKIVTDRDDFVNVPNQRIQGFDQSDAGYVVKMDLDYRFRSHKWTNTFEMEYSESHIDQPDLPEVIEITNNRMMFLTYGTERVGAFPFHWLGDSFGPSLGLQWDGEVKRRDAALPRRNIYSVLPGVEIYDGSLVKSLQLSGNFRRDFSQRPIDNQSGLRARALFGKDLPIGFGRTAKLEGDTDFNYFFRKGGEGGDSDKDLLLEGHCNAKLIIPVWKNLALAPFVDFYYWKSKARPITGYSVISGVSLTFSRLWKPQYEKF